MVRPCPEWSLFPVADDVRNGRFVRGKNGKGDIIKSGGTVVKNVTGYDLSKLLTGSFGTLIALTEITFKVLPTKSSSSTLVIHEDKKKEIANLAIW